MTKIERLKAKDVMVKDIVTISADTTIKELWENFEKHEFNGFPVVKNGRYIGMVFDIDLLKVCVPTTMKGIRPLVSDFWKLFAERTEEIMGRTVPTATPSEDLESIAGKMIEQRIKSITVVEDRKPVGVIALHDIMLHFTLEGS